MRPICHNDGEKIFKITFLSTSLFPESSVTISPDNFVPSSAQSYVTVRLDSSCAEKQSSLDLISCEKAHTQARR